MKSYITVLLMIFFVSCRSVERAVTCAAIEDYKIGVQEACTPSIKHDLCYCYDFDFEKWKAVSEIRREPLAYCEGIQGFKLDVGLQTIRPKLTALGRLKEESCRKNQRQ